VRSDRVIWVNSLTKATPAGPTDPELAEHWVGYPLQQAIADAMGIPAIVANDADVHALASVSGRGLECVITLGTGLGFSVLLDGDPIPHLEFGGLPFTDGRDYDTALGQVGLERDGLPRWIENVAALVEALRPFLYFDHLYLGGGNARLLAETDLGEDVSTVDNVNGLLGCYLLWKHPAWVSAAVPDGQSDEGATASH
jgi:polyphosphate glucokinase